MAPRPHIGPSRGRWAGNSQKSSRMDDPPGREKASTRRASRADSCSSSDTTGRRPTAGCSGTLCSTGYSSVRSHDVPCRGNCGDCLGRRQSDAVHRHHHDDPHCHGHRRHAPKSSAPILSYRRPCKRYQKNAHCRRICRWPARHSHSTISLEATLFAFQSIGYVSLPMKWFFVKHISAKYVIISYKLHMHFLFSFSHP